MKAWFTPTPPLYFSSIEEHHHYQWQKVYLQLNPLRIPIDLCLAYEMPMVMNGVNIDDNSINDDLTAETDHCFSLFSENSFRVGIHTIVTFPLFDVFIMLVIVASSIALAAEVTHHHHHHHHHHHFSRTPWRWTGSGTSFLGNLTMVSPVSLPSKCS